MPTQKLISTPELHLDQPSGAQVRSMAPAPTNVVHPRLGVSIDDVRTEVDDAFKHMETFHNLEPDEIMRLAGGYSARLSYLRVQIMRVEDFAREWRDLRTREIEPALEELRNQREIASRLHSVRELDFKMEGGMP